MKVKEALEALKKQNPEDELFMFYKTKDQKLTFSSNVDLIAKGAVYDEYGKLVTGVLLTREDSK